eukprot:TRINITY_DN3263_c0_g1_i2.p1 TRINITY_DN3263_c0_g1~~TRINITY_DN3263_c0_g1_i2.p1  ORF type:complete len:217 (+),score=5.70 TRINITY_DN3263_c0_g1_i2:122-772(+)
MEPPSNFACNCLLSSAFRHLPFSSPSLSPPSKPNLEPTPLDHIRNLQISVASIADSCIQTLNAATSQNALLRKFHSFCQIRCRNAGSPNSLSLHNFAAILPGDSVAGLVVASGISNFLNIYNTLLVVRLVLTWFPNSPPAIVSPLSTHVNTHVYPNSLWWTGRATYWVTFILFSLRACCILDYQDDIAAEDYVDTINDEDQYFDDGTVDPEDCYEP